MRNVLLPRRDRSLQPYTVSSPRRLPDRAAPPRQRVVYAAAHVVADPLADTDPWDEPQLDWEATLAYRRHLWSLGLSVAEGMDTAQRGMGLTWEHTKELIHRAVAEARAVGGGIASGAGTDQLQPGPGVTIDDVIAAYEEQCEFVESQGSRIVLMASRALAACAAGPDDYYRVYDRILSQVAEPVIIHWLGEAFDPALAGYWGSRQVAAAMDACLQVLADHAAKIDGIKLSLLDAAHEVELRRRLPEGMRMYTGDDFNFPALIRGDEHAFSHALLGIFDAIAPVAAAAMQALDAGNWSAYDALFAPTVPLSRHIFQAPTYHYKTGLVFMAYLNGHQSHFRMVGGQESARSIVHLAELFMLADQAGLLRQPDLAVERMGVVLAQAGITQG